ncbi:MAG: DUF5330 domain-containing protein [Methyloceanibacter sp.]|jgi:hypothetical protein
MFLIRTAFWLIILVLLLPTNEQQQSEVYGTAQAAVKDVSGFCDRNPGVCATGKDAFGVFVEKAQFGVSMLMGFIRQETGGTASDAQAPGADDKAAAEGADAKHSSLDQAAVAQASMESWATAPVTVEPASVEPTNSQNTLNRDDLMPAWGGRRGAGI